MEHGSNELTIRALRADDGVRLVKMDEVASGRRREAWYEGRLHRALEESDVQVSLGAESDGTLVGAILGTVQFGEFGQAEPTAILDTVLVDAEFGRQGVASAMLSQLLENLAGLRIGRLRTQLAWDELDLMAFFGKSGFQPAPRLVLELDVDEGLRLARAREEESATEV
jgi:predicted N-acetyltransferase YhbS